jgi:enoyl-CoA hydratase/carnithine racemase
MGISCEVASPGIPVLTIDYPPVNALPAQAWFDLADLVVTAGRDPSTHVLVLRAAGRGFCAGVDLKEVSRGGPEALIGVNRGCHAAFGAVYDCPVPVIAAVHGFCLGGGIGLAGNADIVVASSDAEFGLPEVDRGALGAATHLSRLVPQPLMRALYYTATTITADDLYQHGSVYRVVPRESLDSTCLELARTIAAKDPRTIRRAKEALNGIDPQDVHRSYRYEQGFTFELNLTDAPTQARTAFLQPPTPTQ